LPSKNHNNKTKQKMKSLNENIGLGGGNGMSHFDGVAVFDPEKQASVISAKNLLEIATNELEKAQKDYDYQMNVRPGLIQADHDTCVRANSPFIEMIEKCKAQFVGPAWADRASQLTNLEAKIKLLKTKTIPEAVSAYENAKTAAIEANNKIVDSQIKVLAEKAKTDPTALEQITKLNEQKLAGEQALASQKIIADAAKNKSSNIKIYVIIGAVVLGLVAVAGIWIWLKSRKAV